MNNIEARVCLLNAKIGRMFPFFTPLIVAFEKHKDKTRINKWSNVIERTIKEHGFEPTDELRSEIWKAACIDLVSADEYFSYKFYEKNSRERHEYVGDLERRYVCHILNEHTSSKIFSHKDLTYQKFQKFYGRDVLKIQSSQDKQKFMDFLEKHKKAFIKPVHAGGGTGARFIPEGTDSEDAFKSIMNDVNKYGEVVVEQPVVQAQEFNRLNPSSVNTVRIATFLDGDKVLIFYVLLRIGRKGMIVDNVSSGGVCVPVDSDTGICKRGFYTKKGENFNKHPECGYEINGFQIPKWKELLKIVDELAHVLPDVRYVGWDLALTDSGWVMIEGNSAAQIFGTQIYENKGLRELVNKTWYKAIKLWKLLFPRGR